MSMRARLQHSTFLCFYSAALLSAYVTSLPSSSCVLLLPISVAVSFFMHAQWCYVCDVSPFAVCILLSVEHHCTPAQTPETLSYNSGCIHAGESPSALQDEEEQMQDHVPSHGSNPIAKPSRVATLRQVSNHMPQLRCDSAVTCS